MKNSFSLSNSFLPYESMLVVIPHYSSSQLRLLAYYYAKRIREWGAYRVNLRYRGKRSLSYSIKGSNVGNYVEVYFQLLPENLSFYQSLINLDANILRSFIKKKKYIVFKPTKVTKKKK